jgi:hypothetical protein
MALQLVGFGYSEKFGKILVFNYNQHFACKDTRFSSVKITKPPQLNCASSSQ